MGGVRAVMRSRRPYGNQREPRIPLGALSRRRRLRRRIAWLGAFSVLVGTVWWGRQEIPTSSPDQPVGEAAQDNPAAATGSEQTEPRPQLLSGTRFDCTVIHVTDGDTFRCSETDGAGRQIRVRLSGVAARETNETCAPGHPCPAASAASATAALTQLASGQTLDCHANGLTYGRVGAFCRRTDGVDLSCAMMDSGTVARWDRYWGQHSC
jgi:endonuclease YncB( thermonuclease family)